MRYLFNFELPSEREARAAIVSAESAAQAAAEAEAAQRELAAEMAAQTAAQSARTRVDAEKGAGHQTPKLAGGFLLVGFGRRHGQTTDESGKSVRRAAPRGSEGSSDGVNRAQRGPPPADASLQRPSPLTPSGIEGRPFGAFVDHRELP